MRGVSLLVSVTTYLFLIFTCSADGTCIRQPEGVRIPKTPGDNGYRLKISGSPEQYVPGEVYTGKFHIPNKSISMQQKDVAVDLHSVFIYNQIELGLEFAKALILEAFFFTRSNLLVFSILFFAGCYAKKNLTAAIPHQIS